MTGRTVVCGHFLCAGLGFEVLREVIFEIQLELFDKRQAFLTLQRL
jgi:hypothetical protein